MTVAVSDTLHTCVRPAPCRRRLWSITRPCCWFIHKVDWGFSTFRRVAGPIISGTVAGWFKARWLSRFLIGLFTISRWWSSCIITMLSHYYQTDGILTFIAIGHGSAFLFIAAKSIICKGPAIVCTARWSRGLSWVATIVVRCRIIATRTLRWSAG